MAGEQPLSQTEILQKLERVGNLESVVTEQRMRMEKLKTTYEMLKAEHIQLQEVCKTYLTSMLNHYAVIRFG